MYAFKEERISTKTKTKTKNQLACNADSGRAVALGVPRSAFLADLQPAGASGLEVGKRKTAM